MPIITLVDYFKDPLIDSKVNGKSWLIKLKIGDYLQMTDLDGNIYQRSIMNVSFYAKLRSDLLSDSTIPPISVVYPEIGINLENGLDTDKKFQILDGLQRTNCLLVCIDDIKSGKVDSKFKTVEDFQNKVIYVELWEKLDLPSILYKMVILNTGQKKMDYAHQLDILNKSLIERLKSEAIEVTTKRDSETNGKDKNKFQLSIIAEGLVSFINRSPILGKKNAAEFLFQRLNIDSTEENSEVKLIDDVKTYGYLIWVLRDLNLLCKNSYNDENPLLKYDPFIPALMASLGYTYEKNPDFLDKKIKVLQTAFASELDPLNLERFKFYYAKFTTSIGDRRRRFIFETLRDFFNSPEHINRPEWQNTYERLY